MDPDVALPVTFVAWSVGGLGMGLLFNPTTVTAMGTAVPGEEGLVSSQMNIADSLGFALMGGLGGAVVAFADRTSVSLSSAILFNMGLALTMATLGFIAARGVVQTVSAPLAARR